MEAAGASRALRGVKLQGNGTPGPEMGVCSFTIKDRDDWLKAGTNADVAATP